MILLLFLILLIFLFYKNANAQTTIVVKPQNGRKSVKKYQQLQYLSPFIVANANTKEAESQGLTHKTTLRRIERFHSWQFVVSKYQQYLRNQPARHETIDTFENLILTQHDIPANRKISFLAVGYVENLILRAMPILRLANHL